MSLRTVFIFLASLTIVWALRAENTDPPAQQEITGEFKTFLNDKKTQGGVMSADSIIYFLDKPLYSQDSAGNYHRIRAYLFTYIERQVYFDDKGKPFIGTEVGGANSVGGRLPDYFIDLLKERIKSGDTVIFNHTAAFLDDKNQSTMYYSPRIVLVVK